VKITTLMEIKEIQQDDLFKLISIYKRMSDQELTEYVCLHNLETELYAVLCANFLIRPPLMKIILISKN
jgi:hypothetical protein